LEKRAIHSDPTNEIERLVGDGYRIEPRKRDERALGRPNAGEHRASQPPKRARKLRIEPVELVAKVTGAENPARAVLQLQHLQASRSHCLFGPVEQIGSLARFTSNGCEPKAVVGRQGSAERRQA
jgi:hypothetical protein